MYYLYIRVVILGVLSRHSSIYRTFTNGNIEMKTRYLATI